MGELTALPSEEEMAVPCPKTSARFQPFGPHSTALQALLNPLHDKILHAPLEVVLFVVFFIIIH